MIQLFQMIQLLLINLLPCMIQLLPIIQFLLLFLNSNILAVSTTTLKLNDYNCNIVKSATPLTVLASLQSSSPGKFLYPITLYNASENFSSGYKSFLAVIQVKTEPSKLSNAISSPHWQADTKMKLKPWEMNET